MAHNHRRRGGLTERAYARQQARALRVARQHPGIRVHCGGKKNFDSLKAAETAAERMTERTGLLFTAYRCRNCGEPHIGRKRTVVNGVAVFVKAPNFPNVCEIKEGAE